MNPSIRLVSVGIEEHPELPPHRLELSFQFGVMTRAHPRDLVLTDLHLLGPNSIATLGPLAKPLRFVHATHRTQVRP